MYLWKRDSGFTFQISIPSNLHQSLGKSPIRLSLGYMSASEAKSLSLQLATIAHDVFAGGNVSKDEISKSLKAVRDQVKNAKRTVFAESLKAGALREKMYGGEDHSADPNEPNFIDPVIDASPENIGRMHAAQAAAKSARAFGETLQTVASAIEQDHARHEAELAASARAMARIARAEDYDDEERDERHFTAKTLLSVAGQSVIDQRRRAESVGERYIERMQAALDTFLEVVGDKRLGYYLPVHLQDYADFMARVPANRSKIKLFRGNSLKDVIEINAKLPAARRKPTLSETTIDAHLAEIRTIWRIATLQVRDVRDITALNIKKSAITAKHADREALPAESLNALLRECASDYAMRKPYQPWLCIVALLSGMRLAELVYLQKSDLKKINGRTVFDLREPLNIDGEIVDRALKTKASKRIVPVQKLLLLMGFPEWVKAQKGDFIFGYYLSCDDPADAAQKQMSHLFKRIGIHKKTIQTFHSLRHNAKHWIRHGLGPLISDKMLGHTVKDAADSYGYKLLTGEEIDRINELDWPEEVDFSPMIQRAERLRKK